MKSVIANSKITCVFVTGVLQEERDWGYIAMVMDRLFLYIFTTTYVAGTLAIFLYAPSLYDPREHMSATDPNSTCQY
jgi:nicotinic acetylcholine receptor